MGQQAQQEKFMMALVAINARYSHAAPAPFYLKAAVEAALPGQIEVEIMEATLKSDIAQLAQKLAGKYCLIGFSCYIWNIEIVGQLAAWVRQKDPKVKILLGGPEASFRAEELLRKLPAVDFVIAGEGERPLPALVQALQKGTPPAEVPGLIYRMENGFAFNAPPAPIEELAAYETAGYLAAAKDRISYLETSRGCPFHCAYCLSGRQEDTLRLFDLEEVKRTLLQLANSGSKTVKFLDRTFNAHPGRTAELLHFILEKWGGAIPEDVVFHLEIEPDLLNREQIALVQSAPPGLFQMEIGIQSLYAPTLAAVRRGAVTEQTLGNIKTLLQKNNLHIHLDLIAGLPLEDFAHFCTGFDRLFALRPHTLQLGFLKLLPGSGLADSAEYYGLLSQSTPPYEVRQTPYLSSEDFRKLHLMENALSRLYNSGHFPDTIEWLLQQTGLSPSELFFEIGKGMEGQGALGAAELAAWLYGFAPNKFDVDGGMLRDWLTLDFISKTDAAHLPPALRRSLPGGKKMLGALERSEPLRQRPGLRRSAVWLPAFGALAVVQQQSRHPVSGRYPVHLLLEPDLPCDAPLHTALESHANPPKPKETKSL